MDTIRQLIEEGKQHFEDKHYLKAEESFKKALQHGSPLADVLNMMGIIHHSEGKFESAIDYFRKALEINPKYTEALLSLAVLYNDLGRYKEAKKLYTDLKKSTYKSKATIEPVLKGKLSNLHADIGDTYQSVGLFDLAVDEYQKALKLNPSYVDIRTKLGVAYRESGDLEKSLKQLKEATTQDANYHKAWIQLGVTYYKKSRLKEAKECWKKVLKKDAGNELAKMYISLCSSKNN